MTGKSWEAKAYVTKRDDSHHPQTSVRGIGSKINEDPRVVTCGVRVKMCDQFLRQALNIFMKVLNTCASGHKLCKSVYPRR
jgi:hypothetical protein